MVDTKLLTAEEFMAIAGGEPTLELVGGQVREVVAAAFNSSGIARRLGRYLTLFVSRRSLGVVTTADGSYVLKRYPDTVRQPDVGFVRAERIPQDDRELDRAFERAPDFAAEVRSARNTIAEPERKIEMSLELGTERAALIDPLHRAVRGWDGAGAAPVALGPDDELTGGGVLPGFRLPARQLFALRDPILVELVM